MVLLGLDGDGLDGVVVGLDVVVDGLRGLRADLHLAQAEGGQLGLRAQEELGLRAQELGLGAGDRGQGKSDNLVKLRQL